jgi:hypothetical protein
VSAAAATSASPAIPQLQACQRLFTTRLHSAPRYTTTIMLVRS